MKKFLALAFAAALLAGGATGARAQSYGQYGGAVPIPLGTHLAGVYINASDNLVGILSQLRLSFYPGIDFGFQGGLARIDLGPDDRTTLRLGTDIKGQIAQATQGSPFDVAIGGHLGVETGDSYDILRLGPSVVVSHTVPLGSSGGLTPYASLGILFARLDTDFGDDSDFSFPLRLGGEMQVMPEFRFLVELQFNINDAFNNDTEFLAGVNLPF